jgi:hypothetical protein
MCWAKNIFMLALVTLSPGYARWIAALNGSHPWETYLSPFVEDERNLNYPNLCLRSAIKAHGAQQGVRTVVFNHNPKAAGTYAVELLEGALSKLPGGRFIVEKERQSVGHNGGFTIGAVREPCNHLVSLWAFGSEHKGGFRKRMQQVLGYEATASLYGLSAPFNSTEDVKRFRKWIRNEGVQGFMTAMFVHSYSNVTGVDCFVVADGNIEEEVLRCLNVLVDQAGDLAATNITSLEISASGMKHNSGSHASCETYFDGETARAVELSERPLYKAFGWAACCVPPASRNKPPLAVREQQWT